MGHWPIAERGHHSGHCWCQKTPLFESQTIVLASLQDQVNAADASSIKKVPVAERETKMWAIKTEVDRPSHRRAHLSLATHFWTLQPV